MCSSLHRGPFRAGAASGARVEAAVMGSSKGEEWRREGGGSF